MLVMRWTSMCVVVLMIVAFQVQDLYAQNIKTEYSAAKTAKADDKRESKKSDGAPKRSSDRDDVLSLKTVNVFVHPLDLILTGLQDVTLSADVRVARFLTLGVDYRTSTGKSLLLEYYASNTPLTGVRLRGDAYLNGRAFTSSVVAQLNYQFLSIQRKSISGKTEVLEIAGPGVMLGWKWFWTDPGESGLNLGMMAGAGALRGENSTERLDKVLLDVRVELGLAF